MSPVVTAARPADLLQLTRQLRDAHQGQSRAVLLGHGTTVPGDWPGARIALTALDQITRFHPDDLTVSVQAGCPLARLLAEVERHGLWLPFDPPDAERRTVGGAFADGVPGVFAFGAQHPRDLLLGLSAVLTDGTVWKTGARVVKNVAGYDLAKLFVGSRGTLFAATELHLRLYPMPRGRVLLASAPLPLGDALALLLTLRRPPLQLLALTALSVEGGKARVVAEAAGDPDVLAWHEARCAPLEQVPDPAAAELRAARARQSFLRREDSGVACTGVVLPSQLPRLFAGLPATTRFAVQGDGRFVVHGADLLAAAEALGGHGRTAAGRQTALAPAVVALAAAIKQALDPERCLPSL